MSLKLNIFKDGCTARKVSQVGKQKIFCVTLAFDAVKGNHTFNIFRQVIIIFIILITEWQMLAELASGFCGFVELSTKVILLWRALNESRVAFGELYSQKTIQFYAIVKNNVFSRKFANTRSPKGRRVSVAFSEIQSTPARLPHHHHHHHHHQRRRHEEQMSSWQDLMQSHWFLVGAALP